jgi:nucleotide-binding universal stress UspA family protein
VSVAPSQQTARRIVVGVDGSATSERALRWAVEQARSTGQALHAVVAWDFPTPYETPVLPDVDWRGEAADALRKTLENTVGDPDAAGVVQHVSRGHTVRVLLDAAAGADLLVVGCRGHGGFTGMLLGSVSQHLIAHAPCPVVVVHEQGAASGRIVVGVDGSPQSEHALRWAADQARTTGRRLHAVLAWQLPFGYGVTARAEPDPAAHGEHLLSTTVSHALGEQDAAATEREVVQDAPAAALLRAAENADLLVVGCRGRGGFAGMLLGSVSRHVAAHASCPVVIHRGVESAARSD